jgi:hypothetical protein
MLFLEKSSGTHFCQFMFPKVRPVVVQLWKKLAWLHVRKAKFSRFYICRDICIDSHRCHGHHGTLTVWLCDLVDTNFIRALHPNMRSAIPIMVNSFHNTGGPRHLWWNCIKWVTCLKKKLHILHLGVAHYSFHKHTWNISICCNVSKHVSHIISSCMSEWCSCWWNASANMEAKHLGWYSCGNPQRW